MQFYKKFARFCLAIIINFAFTVEAATQASLNFEQSDKYGYVVNPHYANLINPHNAFGFDIAFGAAQFRIEGTFAHSIYERHLIKLTADYLSQQIPFHFIVGSVGLWGCQYSLAESYTYLIHSRVFDDCTIMTYQLHSRDQQLAPIHEVSDHIAILIRNMRGADGYGGALALTLLPLEMTRLEVALYLDSLHPRNHFERRSDHDGLGVGVSLNQIITPHIKLEMKLEDRPILHAYLGRISGLLPLRRRQCLELSLYGGYYTGPLPKPDETRYGLMVTYYFDHPQYYCHRKPLDLTAQAACPLIRMPQTYSFSDQEIIAK